MKIKYLGTAAAEGIPAMFCECDNCKKSVKLGGRNIRTRSQALIDDSLLIDFPADTYVHFLQHRIPLHKIRSCLITHSHSDHLYVGDIAMRKKGFAHISEDDNPLTFYSDLSGYKLIEAELSYHKISDSDVRNVLIGLYEPFRVGGFMVTALRASHDFVSSPVLYLVEKGNKTLFYCHDTSEYPKESMDYLRTLKRPLGLISLDCTEACRPVTYVGHLSLERCITLRDKLLDEGIADSHTIFVLNHFSHNGVNVVYEEFVPIAEKHGFLVSYDGMEIEF